MKAHYGIVITSFLIPCVSQAGYFVEKNLYVTSDLVVGKGPTREAAKKDAESAIPKDASYLRDTQGNSPAYVCEGGGEWSAAKECDHKGVQYVLPLKRIAKIH